MGEEGEGGKWLLSSVGEEADKTLALDSTGEALADLRIPGLFLSVFGVLDRSSLMDSDAVSPELLGVDASDRGEVGVFNEETEDESLTLEEDRGEEPKLIKAGLEPILS